MSEAWCVCVFGVRVARSMDGEPFSVLSELRRERERCMCHSRSQGQRARVREALGAHRCSMSELS